MGSDGFETESLRFLFMPVDVDEDVARRGGDGGDGGAKKDESLS